jgi:succinyl-diaminopimelate desuccinylase
MTDYDKIDAWVDAHFDEEVRFLQELVRVPTDTPPGNNAPHAERTAQLLEAFGLHAEKYPVPQAEVQAHGLQSITNLIVRRRYGDGPTIALNAHGDVVPPGEGWTHDPYGGEIVDGTIYGRAAAVSKSDFASFTFAVRALESLQDSLKGGIELHFTYDEEFGGELGPGWLLRHRLTKPDLLIAAGFSYEVGVRPTHSRAGHAAVHRREAVCGSRDSRRDLRRRSAHGAGVERKARRRAAGAGRLAAGDQGDREDLARAALLIVRAVLAGAAARPAHTSPEAPFLTSVNT